MAKTKSKAATTLPALAIKGRFVSSADLPAPPVLVDEALGARTHEIGPRTVAVLPLGATEQHGPHLSPDTDWIIADAIAERACAQTKVDTLLLPAERIGYSPEHLGWGATRTLGYGDAIERWCAFGAVLADRGVRRLLLLNAHGGNSPLMLIAATEMRVRQGLLCVTTSWTRHGDPAARVGTPEKVHGIHAGLIETSVMMALRPDLVRMDKAAVFASLQQAHARERALLRAYGPHAHGWVMEDLNPAGATGDATGADATLGEALIADSANGLARLIEETALFDPPWFDIAHS